MAWIMKIAKNLYLMKIRKDGENKISCFDEYSNDSTLSFDNITNAEDRMFLEQLFSHVSKEERNIIVMHVSMGMKHKEIAEFLGIPIGTVLSKYHRAMKELNKIRNVIEKEVQ